MKLLKYYYNIILLSRLINKKELLIIILLFTDLNYILYISISFFLNNKILKASLYSNSF